MLDDFQHFIWSCICFWMFLGCRFQNFPHSTQRETTHIFQTSFVFCSLFLFFCCQRCLFQFLFFLVGRNVLFYREINWNGRRAFGQFTFQAAPLIDSWPCKYSSCITESTKVHTLTEFVKAVLFRIGTGHSIIFLRKNRWCSRVRIIGTLSLWEAQSWLQEGHVRP